jgi:ribosome recycling factor
MVRQINARTEEGCVAVRNVRRDAIDHLKRAEKAKEISEDELKRFEVEVQKLTDKFIEEIHALQKKKDAELMEV